MIRNARVFKAEMPQAHQTLAEHLAQLPFEEISPGEVKRQGFVPHWANGELVCPFPGGYAFVLRTDERIIPPSVVTAHLDKIDERRKAQGRPPMHRSERQEEREEIVYQLAKTALAKTRYTFAYYLTGPGYLIVDVASRKPANELASRLLQVMEAFKTTTIHIAEAARGLTTRLQQELDEDDIFEDIEDLLASPFGDFRLGDAVKLHRRGETAETVTYAGIDLATQSSEIREQLRNGFKVVELRLEYAETGFKLCQDFALKSFSFPEVELSPEDEEAAEEDRMVRWLADAQLETAAIARIIDALVELLEYKEPEPGQEAV